MADVHPIRLRGPWHYKVWATQGSPAEGELPSGKLQMPADWGSTLGQEFRGFVQYERNFGCPTALEPHESVWLVLDAIDAIGQVSLNGNFLGEVSFAAGPAKFEVTAHLQERNELVVDVGVPAYASVEEERLHRGDRTGQPGGVVGEVRLEIWSGK